MKDNEEVDCSTAMKWDALKATLKGSLISTTAFIKKTRVEEVVNLLSSIKSLEECHKRSGDMDIYKQLQQECRCLELLETEKIKTDLLFLKQKQ